MSTDRLEIVVSGPLPRPEIELNPAAFNAREVALAAAGNVQEIASVTDLDAAAAALTTIKSLTKSVEDSRKDVKAPVLEVGRRIDSVAKEYLTPLEVEARRLSAMVGSYQEAKRREAERIREGEAAKQAAALAEMQAKQAAAERAGDTEAADAARAKAAQEIAASQLAVIAAEGPKADGITTRTNWKFEVTDAAALYASRPELCIVEPNNAAIRAVVKATKGAAIPGLRIWQEAAAVVRAAAPVNVEQFDY
jgi:hypothetical protein